MNELKYNGLLITATGCAVVAGTKTTGASADHNKTSAYTISQPNDQSPLRSAPLFKSTQSFPFPVSKHQLY